MTNLSKAGKSFNFQWFGLIKMFIFFYAFKFMKSVYGSFNLYRHFLMKLAYRDAFHRQK